MSDLVKRLQSNTFLAATHPHFGGVAKDCSEAADEIERLRGLLREAQDMLRDQPYGSTLDDRIDACLADEVKP